MTIYFYAWKPKEEEDFLFYSMLVLLIFEVIRFKLDALLKFILQLISLQLFRMLPITKTGNSWMGPENLLQRRMLMPLKNLLMLRFVDLYLSFVVTILLIYHFNNLANYPTLAFSLARWINLYPSGVVTRHLGMIMRGEYCLH